ncbi:MAG TPA: hypothetical protein VGP07_01265 [Polyangia bacterium]
MTAISSAAATGLSTLLAWSAIGCGGSSPPAGTERGRCLSGGSCASGLVCLSDFCVRPAGADGGSDAGPPASPLVVSATGRTPRTTTWSVNYWQWMPSYGDDVTGTDALMAPLKAAYMRVGGYNNDANTPDPFDGAAFDHAVAYARAIGAEPIIQVPLLADTAGQPPTAATAAGMVTYANVTKGYGLKYFSLGNEPDLYATQGGVTDSSLPAIAGFTPAAYCTTATAYVAAMKAVDPTIKIVGPDLSWQYVAGTSNDWLTPILTGCGYLFDVVAIHRYPFEAMQATRAAAASDAAAFRNTIASVRGILTRAGQAGKPLAITEMNVAYDATFCVLDASPGTVGSALWLADGLGTAIDLQLWTSAVWDISDSNDWALGLIDPARVPRPEYYAYALYAQHAGPQTLQVTTAPAGVSAHASRDAADDATEIIVVNWNESDAPVTFSVTGLPTAPALATFVLPALSIAAVELPDQGAPTVSVYGESQRARGVGPESLSAGPPTTAATDAAVAGGGSGKVPGTNCGTSVVCPKVMLPTPAITTAGGADGGTLTFGSGNDTWQSFTYAAPGQKAPTAALGPDGKSVQIAGGFAPPLDGNWEGVGLLFDETSCVDGSGYTGVQFDFAGDLGGCTLAVGVSFSADLSHADDAQRGACSGTDSNCFGPFATVVPSTTTVKVPFSAMSGGSPQSTPDTTTIFDVIWQLTAPTGTDGGSCAASFTVSNVTFY